MSHLIESTHFVSDVIVHGAYLIFEEGGQHIYITQRGIFVKTYIFKRVVLNFTDLIRFNLKSKEAKSIP